LNHYQLVNDDAQFHPSQVSMEASPKDGSVSVLAAIFVIVILARAGANAKSFVAD
jgi:hypothetical protein